jgi:thioredoxin 1
MTLKTLQSLIESNQKHFVEVGATWCQPCKVLKQILHTILQNNPHLEKHIHIADIDDSEELIKEFGISSVPTIFYIENGSLEIKQGLQKENTILEFLK